MTTFTNESRNLTASAVIKHAFTERCIALAKVGNGLFNELYDRLYTPADRQAIALLQSRFEEFVDCRTMEVAVGGMSLTIGTAKQPNRLYQGDIDRLVPTEEITVLPLLDKHRNVRALSFEADDELGQRCLEFAQDREALQQEINERRAEIMGILNKARTDGQLEVIWPDVMPIAREFIKAKEVSNLPVIPVANLNAALGLPVTAAA